MNLNTKNYAWYAVYVKANHERKIIEALNESNIECYLPLKKSLKQWSDRKKWIEEPLFTSYLFVRVSYIEFYDVLITPGVICYVSFGGRPQSIPEFQINNLKKMADQREMDVVLTKEKIEVGVKAEVLNGPLKSLQGEVVKLQGQSRILIRVESLGCCLYANISKEEVHLLDTTVRREKVASYV